MLFFNLFPLFLSIGTVVAPNPVIDPRVPLPYTHQQTTYVPAMSVDYIDGTITGTASPSITAGAGTAPSVVNGAGVFFQTGEISGYFSITGLSSTTTNIRVEAEFRAIFRAASTNWIGLNFGPSHLYYDSPFAYDLSGGVGLWQALQPNGAISAARVTTAGRKSAPLPVTASSSTNCNSLFSAIGTYTYKVVFQVYADKAMMHVAIDGAPSAQQCMVDVAVTGSGTVLASTTNKMRVSFSNQADSVATLYVRRLYVWGLGALVIPTTIPTTAVSTSTMSTTTRTSTTTPTTTTTTTNSTTTTSTRPSSTTTTPAATTTTTSPSTATSSTSPSSSITTTKPSTTATETTTFTITSSSTNIPPTTTTAAAFTTTTKPSTISSTVTTAKSSSPVSSTSTSIATTGTASSTAATSSTTRASTAQITSSIPSTLTTTSTKTTNAAGTVAPTPSTTTKQPTSSGSTTTKITTSTTTSGSSGTTRYTTKSTSTRSSMTSISQSTSVTTNGSSTVENTFKAMADPVMVTKTMPVTSLEYEQNRDMSWLSVMTYETGFPMATPEVAASDSHIVDTDVSDLSPCPWLGPNNRGPNEGATPIYFTISIHRMLAASDVEGTITALTSLLLQWKVHSCEASYTMPDEQSVEYIYDEESSSLWRPTNYFINTSDSNIQLEDSMESSLHVVFHPTTPNRTLFFNLVHVGVLSTKCRNDLTTFPFDKQTCDFTFMLQDIPERVFYAGIYLKIDHEVFGGNNRWQLESAKQSLGLDRNLIFRGEQCSYAKARLVLARSPTYYLMNLLAPCLVLLAICFFSFLVPPDMAIQRSVITCTIVVSMMVTQSVILSDLPKTNERILFADYVQMMIGVCALITVFHLIMSCLSAEMLERPVGTFTPVRKFTSGRAMDCAGFLICFASFIIINIYATLVIF